MTPIKIKVTPEVARFNAAVENADNATWPLEGETPEQIARWLYDHGWEHTAAELRASAIALGYFRDSKR